MIQWIAINNLIQITKVTLISNLNLMRILALPNTILTKIIYKFNSILFTVKITYSKPIGLMKKIILIISKLKLNFN
jgi:hypothetical protein